MIGNQSVAGMERTFGKEVTADILNSMGSAIFMRAGKEESTAKYISNTIP